ncbi:acetylornithine deacetylase/succinyl-diaminopimelate desuccinylase-like protein [Mumia flava]|uniref:Acetylornithine deacetylase/succinyl-diaminopimelate desuccinylase-like protein n=1 Tax=Mumia flava TaxID=1348852 RepID=A0A0B2BUI8_9ACTN|nr:M20/M25/M40 family metallo-hydrolase [Mumia flava]PJJ57039.1 acetylornithine deacetylase/succinyl-diaminopimelate desuccinylase-like protein [Mumia flava]
MDDSALRPAIAGLMPAIRDELEAMVAIPSCAFPGHPPEPVHAMAHRVADAFGRYGVDAQITEVPGGYPAVTAHLPGPPGAPTVLLYAHYDVQPAPKEQGWTTEPFEPTWVDGRLYGRGAADDKGGIAIHLATLAAFDGRPPVGVRLVVEGEEETISHLEDYVDSHPDEFEADVMVVADMGNLVVGEPVLSVGLRGHVKAVVEVRTLDQPVHSGLFGGAAPDALMALITMLAQLIEPDGTSRVPGIASGEWEGADYSEDMLRDNAGVLDGVDLVGSGRVASRLWARPSVSVLGIDCPSVSAASNVLHPSARALVALRIPPGQDEHEAVTALQDYLRSLAPWHVHVETEPDKVSPPFSQGTDGRAFGLMTQALETAYGHPVHNVGSGGSIPLLETLRGVAPEADFVLIGPQDAQRAAIHGPNESVDPAEIERMALAQALLLQALAE